MKNESMFHAVPFLAERQLLFLTIEEDGHTLLEN